MRAEAVSWDDWSVSNPPPIADDMWHVQFAPDEVKILSLEQLDDLFRLSIVDSETQVWQTGMSEWQPLRVIAGLDEQPAPAPKRTPPKPPALNRTLPMPPAPPTRAAPPSAYAAPRPASSSVRPAAPTSIRPAAHSAPPPARPTYVAPASFYPEPILAVPSVYPPAVQHPAPIAFAATAPAMNSVRPLVVSHAPPVARGGGGFGRFLVGLALLAGVGVTAYRNDLLRVGAHEVHQDTLYARLESALGGPAFGTLRALEQDVPAQLTIGTIGEPPPRLSLTAPAQATPDAASPSPSPSPSTVLPSSAGAAPPVVSLESITQEKKGPSSAKAAILATPAPAPARAAGSFAQSKQAAPAVAKASPVAGSPRARAVEKPAPVPQKPASEMSDRERLNAAIGQSVMQSDPPKGKKGKAKGNEYDPLNPNL